MSVFSFSCGHINSQEDQDNAYVKCWGDKKKSIMVCYGIFWSGQLGDPVCGCSLSVQKDLTGEQALIRFLVLKGY